jgi:hypothetical protein
MNRDDEHKDIDRAIHDNELREHYEGMSNEQLVEELQRLDETPEMQRINEGYTPRIYVTFLWDATAEVARVGVEHAQRRERVTFGPYTAVEVSNGKMHATEISDDGKMTTIVIATMVEGSWTISSAFLDGALYWVNFHTVPPRPVAAAPR